MIPLLLFFLLDKKKDENVVMPPYYKPVGMATYEDRGRIYEDTLYYQVPEVRLVNQMADTVLLNSGLRGKILIMNFFFTSCPTVCPEMSRNIGVMQKSFKKKIPEYFQFVSVSIDPENDSVAAIRAYANRYTFDHDKWWFLTGDRAEIYRLMKDDLGLILEGNEAKDLEHSNKIVLIDADRHIRGYYNALDPKELQQCAEDAIFLTMERKKKRK